MKITLKIKVFKTNNKCAAYNSNKYKKKPMNIPPAFFKFSSVKPDYTKPWSSMASTTRTNPAMLAPAR